MTLYQQLKASGNPQAPVQVVITLLASHTVREVAEILGISTRWVYTLQKRYLEGRKDLRACLRKRGPKNPMPNRTPH
ncbi:MAG: helix-turn-helix domain-containing protein, partial [Candidatus Atribacteria bacterium]|nr:helix-turn-helix domain-containing protein [Candidatus Atribacteria bacterium]